MNGRFRILVTGEHDDLPGRLPSGDPIEWISLPVLSFERLAISDALMQRVVDKPFDWILFSSPRVVTFWNEVLLEHGLETPIETQVACIGESTAEKASLDGYTPDFYPTEPGSETFLEEFADLLGNSSLKPSVFIPMAEGGRTLIGERLREMGCDVTTSFLYRTSANPEIRANLSRTNTEALNLVVFTSPSSVDALLDNFTLAPGTKVGAIGQFTSGHLSQRGIAHKVLPGGNFSRVSEIL